METLVEQSITPIGSFTRWTSDLEDISTLCSMSTVNLDDLYDLNLISNSLPEILNDNKVSWHIKFLLFVKKFRNSNYC